MLSRLIILSLAVCFFQQGLTQNAFEKKDNASNTIAILGAMESEVDLLKQRLAEKHDTLINGIPFFTGVLSHQRVVIARSGVGKVNAAIITTLLLEHFKPRCLLFTGIAGSLNPALRPGDVVIGKSVGYHDYGKKTTDSFENWATKNPFNFETNPMFFSCDSLLLLISKTAIKQAKLQQVANHLPAISYGRIITGDVFLSDGKLGAQLRKKSGADAVEMEGAAVAQTCYQQHTPFLVIRSLSDNANHSASLDFSRYGKIAAENSAAIIMELLKLIGDL